MSVMNCWKCKSETVQTGYFTYQETQTTEVMKWPKCYCVDYCECEPYWSLEDQTYLQRTLIFKCSKCGLQFQTDVYGMGLNEIDQNLAPEQQQETFGDFTRINPDPVLTE